MSIITWNCYSENLRKFPGHSGQNSGAQITILTDFLNFSENEFVRVSPRSAS